MRIKMYSARTFLVTGVAVVAITTAPTALAGPSEQACTDIGGSTQCQRIGNVQIYTAPKDLPATPKSTYGPFLGYHDGRN